MAQQINFIPPEPSAIRPLADMRTMRILERYDFDVNGILTLCGGIPSTSVTVHEFAIDYVSDTAIRCSLATNLYNAIRRINFDIRALLSG